MSASASDDGGNKCYYLNILKNCRILFFKCVA